MFLFFCLFRWFFYVWSFCLAISLVHITHMLIPISTAILFWYGDSPSGNMRVSLSISVWGIPILIWNLRSLEVYCDLESRFLPLNFGRRLSSGHPPHRPSRTTTTTTQHVQSSLSLSWPYNVELELVFNNAPQDVLWEFFAWRRAEGWTTTTTFCWTTRPACTRQGGMPDPPWWCRWTY